VANFISQASLAGNGTFRSRVQVAMAKVATAVQGEAQAAMGNAKWQKRQQLATLVLNNPSAYLDRFVYAVVQNSTVAMGSPVAISSSTNATPTVVTTAAAHGLAVGDTVEIASHLVNTNANGGWEVTVVGSTTTFTVAVGANGVGTASGYARKHPIDSDVEFQVTASFDDIAGVIASD
jgi:hypothetical protein